MDRKNRNLPVEMSGSGKVNWEVKAGAVKTEAVKTGEVKTGAELEAGVVKVYGMDVFLLEADEAFEAAMNYIPANLRARVEKCRNAVDKRRRLAGFLLLLHALEQAKIQPVKDRERQPAYDLREGGKPYLADYPDFHFNISHSGNLAVCAVFDREVGIDIQERRMLHGNIAARFFSETENAKLNTCETKEEQDVRFFRYWSAKEAYVKFTGEGLAQGLAHIEADLENGMISDKRCVEKTYETWTGQKTKRQMMMSSDMEAQEMQPNGERTAWLWETQINTKTDVGEENADAERQPDYFLAVCSDKTMRVEMEWIKTL